MGTNVNVDVRIGTLDHIDYKVGQDMNRLDEDGLNLKVSSVLLRKTLSNLGNIISIVFLIRVICY